MVFEPLAPAATVTNAPTTIEYNPVAYTTPTDYSVNIIGAAPTQRMLVFATSNFVLVALWVLAGFKIFVQA